MLDKKYDFHKTETRLENFWAAQEIYRYHSDSTRKTFSIDTPPPTVSGRLHIGPGRGALEDRTIRRDL